MSARSEPVLRAPQSRTKAGSVSAALPAGVPAIEAVDVSRTYQLDGVSVPALRG